MNRHPRFAASSEKVKAIKFFTPHNQGFKHQDILKVLRVYQILLTQLIKQPICFTIEASFYEESRRIQ